ncbi:protein patched isoform X2 [Bemisia tabaci]|uniref:protein patched isoform X2 n=1 Tax=Bemisia tabaci TaxID=7038 RepID=UPI0008F98F46|nr:PREDICTED: protein patched isoform X2 [Bemisia tabaci]
MVWKTAGLLTFKPYKCQNLLESDGKAVGQPHVLSFKAKLQAQLFDLGCDIQKHAGKVLFVAILVLASFCVGLKSAVVQTRVDQLWIEEGGRLEQELNYTKKQLGEAVGNTYQLLIQTPQDHWGSVLHPNALLTHLKMLEAAASVTVYTADEAWRLKDICYAQSMPNFGEHYINKIFEIVIPCAISTPLDCFWEGSKLLGPPVPVTIPGLSENVSWTNLNPTELVNKARSFSDGFPIGVLEDLMKRAGITTGYQEKPCINPRDPECPMTAPNKFSSQPPDIGAELTGGCYGFAAKHMHWPEELIIGGISKNKSGYINKARALQSVVELMGERDLYDFWFDSAKTQHLEWSQQKAAMVLELWQKKFSEEVKKIMAEVDLTGPYAFFSFSTATLNEILGQFTEFNIIKVAIGYLVMLFYAGFSLLKWVDPVKSQCGVGMLGVLLVSGTIAAGLGFCAVFGIVFNASTTQIVPFVALGLGVQDIFLLTQTYAEQSAREAPPEEQTGLVLKKTGVSIILSSLCNVLAFFCAAIIPIPALRILSLQAAILLLFNLVSMILVFPAIVSLDLRRRRSGRVDLLCCCCCFPTGDGNWPCMDVPPLAVKKPAVVTEKLQSITRALPPDRQQTVTVLAPQNSQECWVGSTKELLSKNCAKVQLDLNKTIEMDRYFMQSWSWKYIALRYAPLLTKSFVRVMSMFFLITVLIASIWGITKVKDGLDLTDVVPQGTDEYFFLEAQSKFFGFYNMYAVTKGDFEYPTNQKLLYEYHEAFMQVPNILKNDNGGLPDFWLSNFRDWLLDLQAAFEDDWKNGCINQEKWFSNATEKGVLAYRLLVQTGHVDNPVDKSLVTTTKLVNKEGYINPKAFYNYLSAWAWNDPLSYQASQGNLRPIPKEWTHYKNVLDLKIPKSAPLSYTQLPFYLSGLKDTGTINSVISHVRSICETFKQRSLPNFPSGIPFVFWEQYQNLRLYLAVALLVALFLIFILVTILLLNIWAAALVAFMLIAMVLQMLGLMGFMGVKLSAIPAVLLIVALGVGVNFTVHICLSFMTCIGSRERRTRLAVEHMLPAVVHGGLTTVLSVATLAVSDFDFIVRYFFFSVIALVGIGLVNGLVFFPVLLSLIGPPAEVIPLEHPDRMSTPSPEPVKKIRHVKCRTAPPPRRHSSREHKEQPQNMMKEPSLTTITEEPGSWHSQTHETIFVQPEVVVEITTCTHHHVVTKVNGVGETTVTSTTNTTTS